MAGQRSMKISELRPCSVCGGKIAPFFYMVKVTHMAINQNSINQTLGLNTMFGGRSLALAEMFTADTEAAVEVSTTEVVVCQDCMLYKLQELMGAIEQKNNAKVGAGSNIK